MFIARKLLAVAALGLASGFAHAGNISWSIGINLPPVGTVISNAPVYAYDSPYYAPAPSYYVPPAVVYRPAPVYYGPPAAVVYRPVPRYVGPPAYVVDRRWAPSHRHWEHRGGRPGHRGHGHGHD